MAEKKKTKQPEKKEVVEKQITKEVKEEPVKKEQEVKVEKKVEVKPKEKKDKYERGLVYRIINIALWIVLIVWMIIVFTDYVKVRNEEEPKFCWGEKTTKYDDGIVTECKGLGYKVINYQRTSFKAIEFGPFWIKDRTAEEK